jgi:hypothetical protein
MLNMSIKRLRGIALSTEHLAFKFQEGSNMNKTRKSRRVLAGMLALALVFGTAPANFFNDGFLAGAAISASAEGTEIPQSGENEYVRYLHTSNGFDVQGRNGNNYIPTTFGNGGYRTLMQVGGNEILTFTDFAYGKEYVSDGVSANITAQLAGRTVNIIYTLTNTTNETKTVRLGSCADIQIGSDDSAPCSFTNNGIKMVDHSNTNQFVLIPGNGYFTTRWYGPFGDRVANIFNNREDTSVYDSDSGIAWSWTIEIPAGATVTKKARLSAGDASVSQVAFDANGGTGGMDTVLEMPGEHITLDTNKFVRDGYLFKGWDTNSAGETVVYADGAEFEMQSSDTVLYAVWESNFSAEPQAGVSLTYDGNGQDLITAGEVKEGKIVYAMGDNDETAPESDAFSDNIPGFANAGTYYVWYKVVDDNNNETAKPVCIEVTIDKADPTFIAPLAKELYEDDTVQDLVTTGDCDGGKIVYALGTDATTTPDEDAFGDEIPTADESGTYYVWYKVIGDENHNDTEPACVPVTMGEGQWLVGDVNNDGKINVADIAKTAAHVKGLRILTKGSYKRANVNYDDAVDINDVVKIAAHVKCKRMLEQKTDTNPNPNSDTDTTNDTNSDTTSDTNNDATDDTNNDTANDANTESVEEEA